MSVSSEVFKDIYTCDIAQYAYPYTFKILDDTEVGVIKKLIADGTETILTLDTDYSVSGVGDDAGGNITLITALADTYQLIIKRSMEYTQGMDLVPGDNLPAEVLEKAIDRLTMLLQQLKEAVDRAIIQDVTQTTPITLPSPVADKVLGWDSAGTALENKDPSPAGPEGPQGPAGPTGAGSGDVLGPATNTDEYVPQWDGTDSKTLKGGLALGVAANNIPQMTADGKYPAASGENITGIVVGTVFGTEIDCTAAGDHDNEIAATDGIVEAYGVSSSATMNILGKTDGAYNPPTTVKNPMDSGGATYYCHTVFRVKKGERWLVAISGTGATLTKCTFTPIGS